MLTSLDIRGRNYGIGEIKEDYILHVYIIRKHLLFKVRFIRTIIFSVIFFFFFNQTYCYATPSVIYFAKIIYNNIAMRRIIYVIFLYA